MEMFLCSKTFYEFYHVKNGFFSNFISSSSLNNYFLLYFMQDLLPLKLLR